MPAEYPEFVLSTGACEVDLARRELRVLGSPVPIGARAFDIIEILVQSAGEIVTKDQLLQRVWPGAIVSENTLQVHAVAIRKALGPYRDLLKTESRRGYRLTGDWTIRRHEPVRQAAGLHRIRADGKLPVTNLAATVTRLVGRSTAIAQLRNHISAYRMVTLTGPGGIGKTTLATTIAYDLLGDFTEGGWIVELASLSDPSLLASAVMSALRLPLGPSGATAETVARAIGDKDLLLVLDNCEHIIDAVALLAETLLGSCRHLTILATSREIFRIRGEYVYRVPPLEVPAAERVDAVEILSHSAAELFIARARELDADFSSNAAFAPLVAAICRQLDGIPLAIEFAAARAATLGIAQVASGLRNRFEFMTSGRRTALPRHRTLRATLDWSYDLLSEMERDLLQRLGIFAGPFSLQAACAVAADCMSDVEVASGLAGLVDKSLVVRTANPGTVEFRLLETTRVYALDRLMESGAHLKVAHRHAAHLQKTLGNFENVRRSSSMKDRTALYQYADEVHVALEWAFSANGDTATGVALTIAAFPVWFELFQMTVARGRAKQALSCVEAESRQEVQLRLGFGHAIWYMAMASETDNLELTFRRSLAIAERLGETDVQTQALWGLWAARRAQGDYRGALMMAHRYAEVARKTGDEAAVHLGDRILALTHHYLGEQVPARRFAERALHAPQRLDGAASIGYQVETPVAMTTLLARILWVKGYPDQALTASRNAIDMAQRTGHMFPMVYALVFAGLPTALWAGEVDDAHSLVDILRQRGASDPSMEAPIRCFEGIIRLRKGGSRDVLIASFVEARVDIPTIRALSELISDPSPDMPTTEADYVEVLWNTPELLRIDAEILLWHDAVGAAEVAEKKLLRALEIARSQSALSWELRAAMSLARLWRQDRLSEAHELLGATYGKFTEGLETRDLIQARTLLADFERLM